MKISSILAVTALVSSASAFVPPAQIAPSSALNALDGREIRAARGTYANHGTGEIGSFDRLAPQAGAPIASVMGEDVRNARGTYANHGTGEIGSFDRHAPMAGARIPSNVGDEVRAARSTYAAHGAGEIGSDQRVAFVPQPAREAPDHEGDWMT